MIEETLSLIGGEQMPFVLLLIILLLLGGGGIVYHTLWYALAVALLAYRICPWSF